MLLSVKAKLVRYQVGDTIHTSIWRRHETWQEYFHQETKIEKIKERRPGCIDLLYSYLAALLART